PWRRGRPAGGGVGVMNAQTSFDWLAEWYNSQCDGLWEHSFGVRIDTIDNPGWSLTVDLNGTDLEGRCLSRVAVNYGDELEWRICWVEDGQFNAAGGPLQLSNMIDDFRQWSEGYPKSDLAKA
ncbi:MAG: immunity 53 family protein, partial [Croceibacterium sp.]